LCGCLYRSRIYPRSIVAEQIYNISASKYEALRDIAQALVKEYGIENGIEFVAGEEGRAGPKIDRNRALTGWSQ
jgi:hypothetical protein